MANDLKGFEIRVAGQCAARRRASPASRGERMVMFCFLLSGGLAGLAGISEIASTVGQLQPPISPGYGFTAIIVAFLGRLNPDRRAVRRPAAGAHLSRRRGRADLARHFRQDRPVFQGILLFFILACDTLILYRIALRGLPRLRIGSG